MVKILLIGATGFIGLPLAQSLLRAGHTVYGVARSPQRATELARNEIVPVSGSADDSAAFLALIKSYHIDVVIDLSGSGEASHKILTEILQVGKERLDSAKAAGINTPPKLGFIYVSGIWVHGSSDEPVNELSPTGVPEAKAQAPAIVGWRPRHEREVLATREILDVMIVRPGLIYGRSGSLWNFILAPVIMAAEKQEMEVEVAVDPTAMVPLIHVDDAVSGLHLAVEKLPLISGTGVFPVFDLLGSRESLRLVIATSARALGYLGKVICAGPGDNMLAQAMSTSMKADSSRAIDLLGWRPRISGMVDGIDRYIMALKACQETNHKVAYFGLSKEVRRN